MLCSITVVTQFGAIKKNKALFLVLVVVVSERDDLHITVRMIANIFFIQLWI